MGLLDNGLKASLGPGIAIGVGAVLLIPAVRSALGGLLRPVAKAAIKGVILLGQGSVGLFAEAKESVTDLIEEVKYEVSSGE
jgi:divalent metal cation (Fe/Co/Zn/Cd) transporter